MDFSRPGNHPQATVQESVDIYHCIQEASNLLALSDQANMVVYINHCDKDLTVIGDTQRLIQVFINLLSNARDASPDESIIEITGKADGNSAIIKVCDPGSGIPKSQLEHVFDPFYTTKDPDKGTGLGLPLVYSIIEEHGGHIQLISPANKQTDRGTIARVSLPTQKITNNPTDELVF